MKTLESTRPYAQGVGTLLMLVWQLWLPYDLCIQCNRLGIYLDLKGALRELLFISL